MNKISLFVLKFYKKLLSPYLPMACRFYPTCSEYMYQAIDQHGFGYGLLLGIGRLCRCHPWGGSGVDSVPCLLDQPGKSSKFTTIIHYWYNIR